MSRTYREYVERNVFKENKGTCYTEARDGYQSKKTTVRDKKMKTYGTKRWHFKYSPSREENTGLRNTGAGHKEIINNVNRGRKKSIRQYLKKELQKELDEMYCVKDNLETSNEFDNI